MSKPELGEITELLKDLFKVIEKHDYIFDDSRAGFPSFVKWSELDLDSERVKAAITILEDMTKPAPLNEKVQRENSFVMTP